MADDLRARAVRATFDEVAEHGLSGLTVDAVAVRAGTSRATLYRHFPGGRDQLVREAIELEVRRFFGELASATAGAADPVDHVDRLIAAATRLLEEHVVLQQLLAREAEAFLPALATVQPLVLHTLGNHLHALFRSTGVPDDVDIGVAADYVARMILSHLGSSGRWDLHDPGSRRRLVAEVLLAGLVETGVTPPPR